MSMARCSRWKSRAFSSACSVGAEARSRSLLIGVELPGTDVPQARYCDSGVPAADRTTAINRASANRGDH
ncbi:hypothetical protein NOVOSPHI9U_40474 [Novosphingobium sp. 9U]|nr:hypothetical protein NOVOSPHI9U_40474 [Novosphingobium sp. 9U]